MRIYKERKWIILLALLFTNILGCVGPSTPFGAIDKIRAVKPSDVEANNPYAKKTRLALEKSFPSPFTTNLPRMTFAPDRQVYHLKTKFKVSIFDPRGIGRDSKLSVYYNNFDITHRFHTRANEIAGDHRNETNYEFDDLGMVAGRRNEVTFVYQHNNSSAPISRSFEAPTCNIFARNSVGNTQPFKPEKDLLNSIESWSEHHNVNPNLTMGLIAQESAFDPAAVSWAKAIGLTQVTPLAADEIVKTHRDWPIAEEVSRFPASIIKSMILTGQISQDKDWRLDPEKSVRGGLTYLDYLHKYWTKEENYNRLLEVFVTPNTELTNVILASYNSGAARVNNALKLFGDKYLDNQNLDEAKKYVERINSYCYHFGKQEVSYAQAP